MAQIGKKRYISTKFWDDSFIIDLDPIEKLLFMYFLTNPLTNIAGIYEISIRRISFDTGIDKDMVLKIIDRFTEKKKLYYVDGYIVLPNSHKYQNLDNPKIKKGAEIIINELPQSLIDKILPIHNLYITYAGLRNNINININNNINNKEEEKSSSKELFSELDMFIERWNNVKPFGFAKLGLKKNRKITNNLKAIWIKKRKEYKYDEIVEGVSNYIGFMKEVKPQEGNDYYKHRFTIYEFLKQNNGLDKHF